MQSTVNFQQVKELLQLQLETLWQKELPLKAVAPLMLWGPPGVGKSTLISEVAREQGIGFVDIRLSQREPVDLRGLPMPDGDRVKWLLSSEWPRDPDSRGIILFDEISAADRSLQVAAYELILDRRLGDLYTLPDGWLVCAAGNRAEDNAVALPMSSALANRFCHLEVEADLETWCDWALAEKLSAELIAFLRFAPKHFFSMQHNLERGWPSPRSWERVGRMLPKLDTLTPELKTSFIAGLVGPAAAMEFTAFCQWTRKLPAMTDLLEGRVTFEKPARADQNYALAVGLAEVLLSAPGEKLGLYCHHFLKIGQQLSSDFAAMSMGGLLKVPAHKVKDHASLLQNLYGSREFEPWLKAHGDIFSRQLGNLLGPADASATPAQKQAAVKAKADALDEDDFLADVSLDEGGAL